jgi:hypothetical protein
LILVDLPPHSRGVDWEIPVMRKTYAKPTLLKRDALPFVAADKSAGT